MRNSEREWKRWLEETKEEHTTSNLKPNELKRTFNQFYKATSSLDHTRSHTAHFKLFHC